MPSRRRWVGHSTPKPAFADSRSNYTPANGRRRSRGTGSDSGSETVSENEQTLRSYSSRAQARHVSVRMRPLPSESLQSPLAAAQGAKAAHSRSGLYPGNEQLRQTASARIPRTRSHAIGNGVRRREKRKAGDDSGGETTETDEEMLSHVQTPVPRRRGARNAQGHTLDPAERGPRVLPVSEPPLQRRSRKDIHNGARGTNLTQQLSELVEETDEIDPGLAEHRSGSHDSSISLSPSPSRGQQRHARRRTRAQAQASGSETETDTELAGRIPGSETETETTNSTASGGVAAAGDKHPARLRPHSRSQLPPVPPLRRNGEACGESDGDTTETDDDFFPPPRTVSSSAQHPRRAVPRLAGLRAQQLSSTSRPLPQPSSSGLPATARLPHTTPATAEGEGSNMGLGISSGRPGQRSSSGRVLSTPSLAASSAMSSAVHGMPPPQSYVPDGHSLVHHGSSMPQEPPRDPFTHASEDLTYRGAALRRLEKSYARGGPAGTEHGTVSRKRALTAPSSYDPPLRRRALYGLGGKMITSADSLLEDEHEGGYTGPGSGYSTPPEHGRHLGSRNGLLGESPVSSLRSSLLSRAPGPPQPAGSAQRTPQTLPTHTPLDKPPGEDEPADMASGPGSPSMDAALRQSRKRRRSPSSATSSPMPSQQPASPGSRKRISRTPPSTAHQASPRPELMFPPIDSDTG
ncbi:hypothetical protein GGF46_004113 [Coemansia sp. RSA 552]|nr:hypothetical protein GGF46_004113 [Coemansia sp. RSA 552]